MAAGSGWCGALQIPLFKEEIKEGEKRCGKLVGKEEWLAKPPVVCNNHKGELEREDEQASYSHTPKAARNKEPLCRALCVNHGGAKRRSSSHRTATRVRMRRLGGAGWS